MTRRRFGPRSASEPEAERYRVELSSRAVRDLERLPLAAALAVWEHLDGPVAENPYRLGKPLRDRWSGYRSTRRGGYRAIYRIDEDRRVVQVAHIGARADVYGT